MHRRALLHHPIEGDLTGSRATTIEQAGFSKQSASGADALHDTGVSCHSEESIEGIRFSDQGARAVPPWIPSGSSAPASANGKSATPFGSALLTISPATFASMVVATFLPKKPRISSGP